jgi:hypothetical protein
MSVRELIAGESICMKSVKEGISRSVKYLREHKDSLMAWLKGERARK